MTRLLLTLLTAAVVGAVVTGIWRWLDPQPVWIIGLVAIEMLIVFVYGFAAAIRRYWNILIAVDQLANTLGGGGARETISTRAARQSHKRGWHMLGRFLDRIDPGHMARSLDEPEHKPGWQ